VSPCSAHCAGEGSIKVAVIGDCKSVGLGHADYPSLLVGGGVNENTSDAPLVGCVCCNITPWVSESVLLGDARATKDSEMVDHRFLFIKEFIGCGRFTCIVKEFLDMEAR
jgi:hypothetical protein